MKSDNLDRIDILSRLQENNRIANQTLAAEVGLSPPACLQRVKRLRESGLKHHLPNGLFTRTKSALYTLIIREYATLQSSRTAPKHHIGAF